MLAATFRHVASRNGDPQLHTHAVIANVTRNARGEWRSLDFGGLHAAQHLIGAYYRNELAARLRADGFALVPSMVGHVPSFEIAGYSRKLLDAFSSRRRDILAYMEERGWRYSTANAQKATLATRGRKAEPKREELEARWAATAEEFGAGAGQGGDAPASRAETGRGAGNRGAVGA